MSKNWRKNVSAFVMVISLIVIFCIFTILVRKGVFLSPRNISVLAKETTITAVLAMGMMFVIVAGHIDLSVGSVMGCAGTVAAVLQVWYGWSTPAVIIVAVLLGMIGGAWHGYWVAYRNVPAFIITLGGMLIFRGLKFVIGKSMSIAPMQPSFSSLGQSYLPNVGGWILAAISIAALIFMVVSGRRSKAKYHFATAPVWQDILKIVGISFAILFMVYYFNKYKGFPMPVLIMVVIAVVLTFMTEKTIFGRNVYAIGGNEEASALSGIKTKVSTMWVFILCSAMASIAGVMLTARLDAATPAAGDGKELDAIAACVIGGTSMTGGVGKIVSVIIGALVMASLDNGMSLINLESAYQYIVKGLVLTLAVWADTMSKQA